MKTLFFGSHSARELKRLVKETAAEGKPLSIMEDAVFKAMLASDNDDSREALRSLLSACTHRKISNVQAVNNEPVRAHPGVKAVRLDVKVVFNEETEHDRLTEATEIIFYELPKLERKVNDYLAGTSAGLLSEEEKWCIYMKYRHEESAQPLIEELCRKEEGIMRAEQAVQKVSRSYRKAMREMDIIKNSMDRAERHYQAGRAEGLEESKLEIARNALAEGATLEFVQKITGLDIETIQGFNCYTDNCSSR